MIKRTSIIETIVVLNIILFLYTGIAKIMDYGVFKAQLEDSPILGFAAKLVAISLPIIEFIVVILLAIPRWRLKGLYSSLFLMSAFTTYIVAMFIVSPEMPCSCGGILELLSWQQHLFFNGAVILLNLWGIAILRKHIKETKQAWHTNIFSVSHG